MYKKIISLMVVVFFIIGCGQQSISVKKTTISKPKVVNYNRFIVTKSKYTVSKPILKPKFNMADYSDPNFKTTKPFIQLGHSGGVYSVAITPDGKYALSGGDDKTIKLWEIKTGREIRTFIGHLGMINSIAITPNGKYALSGSWDGTLKLWDIKTGKEIRTFKSNAYIISSVAITPNGKYVISGDTNKILELWDINTGKKIRDFKGHSDVVNSVAITPNGKYVLSGSRKLIEGSGDWGDEDNKYIGELKLWDIKTGKNIKDFIGHSDDVCTIAITPNGKYILSGSKDSTLKLWDIKTGKEIKTFRGHFDFIYSVAITPNGKYILSSSLDQTLKLWDINTGKLIKNFKGDILYLMSIAITPNGKYVLSGSADKTLKLWDINTGKKIRDFKGYSNQVNSIAITPNGRYALLDNYKTLKLWDIKTGKEIRTFKGHKSDINSVAITPNGKYAISGSDDETIKLWDIKTGKEIRTFKGHSHRINSVAITPDGKYVLSGSVDDTLKLWDIKTGKNIKTFKGHTHNIEFVSITPNGKYVVSGSFDGTLKLWDIKTGKEIRTLKVDNLGMKYLVITPDGKYVLYDADIRPKLWDINTGKVLEIFSSNGIVTSVAITPNGKYIVCGRCVLCDTLDTLKVRDIKTGKGIKVFRGHTGSLTITPNGKYAISRNSGGTVKYWNLKTEEELLTTVSFSDGEWVSITPEGYFNASKNGAKHLNILTGPMEVSSIDQYYETFYRPDIVASALTDYKIDTDLHLADVKPAPSVEIIKTLNTTNEDEIKITLKIKEQQKGGIGDIRLYLNGVSVKIDISRALKLKKDDAVYKTYTLKLVNGKNNIKAIVFNEANTMQSKDALHTVIANIKSIYKPTLHALIIGINEFKNPKLTLKYASSDAELFSNTLKQSSKGLFEEVKITTLNIKSNTTKKNIIDTIKSYKNINPNDLFVFYVASHGTVDDGEYFLITSNVGSTSTRKLKKDAISQTELKNLLANVPTTKKMIVFDTCNAGKMGDSLQMAILTRGMSEDTAMKVLSRAVGSTILSAANSQQEALEGYKNHGLFTYVLSEGLKGKADSDNDGFVKTRELANYVEDEVPELAEKIYNRAQYPVISPTGQAFPIGRVK